MGLPSGRGDAFLAGLSPTDSACGCYSCYAHSQLILFALHTHPPGFSLIRPYKSILAGDFGFKGWLSSISQQVCRVNLEKNPLQTLTEIVDPWASSVHAWL